MNFALTQIGQISVTVHDIERAVAFYRDMLGMKHLFSSGQMAFFECGAVRLMLALPEKPEFDHPSSILYYKVADVVATHAELSARGVTFRDEPHVVHRAPTYELWMTFFNDTEGNTFALMAEKPI